MLLSRRFALLAGTSIVALAVPAMAQDAQPTEAVVLDEVVLDATAPTQGYVVPTSQIATKTETPVIETQQSVSIITKQQFEDQGAQSMTQALRYTAGVTAEPFGGDPRFDQPNLRGFDVGNSQYLNGLHLIRDFGAMGLELYGLERVEVLRGPSSGLYGSGSPGGIINMVQKHAQFDNFSEAGLGFGTNQNSLFFDVNRSTSDDMAWRLTGLLSDNEEQVDEVTNERGYLAAAASWQMDDASTLDLMLSYQKDSPISPAGVPYGLTQDVDAEDARDFYAGYPDADDSDRKMLNLGVEYKRELDNGWRLEQGFRYQKFDWKYTGFFSGHSYADGIVYPGAIYQDESSNTVHVDTRLLGEATTGAVTHKLVFGVDISRWSADNTTEFNYSSSLPDYWGTVPPLNFFDPDYSVSFPRSAGYRDVQDLTIEQTGIYAQDEISWNNWRATLVLRHDWAEQTGSAVSNFVGFETVTDAGQKDEATTGRVGVSYLFANGVAPYVSYATSFEPEIGIYRGSEAYKPTEGKQWEAGVKYQPTSFDALITAAVYDLKQQNVRRTVAPGIDEQIGEVHVRGFELEGTAELAEGWDIRGAYSYTDAVQKGGDKDGLMMTNTPYNAASIWLDRDFGNGVRVGGGIRYIGERYGNLTNTYKIDSVTLGDLGASYTRDNVVASVNVTNITDEAYVASCSDFGCFYGDGREVQARLTYKW
ncbi:TonB-dependent siderophore receptor [Paracoccus aestuariivivens]|uniref:TonB-dependent siderophore receptor n=1 Tax=Paracoccus aestuariivivens TaxID=1820333 RepID=A0A6L6J7G5_9RHOB|nr:TonB-dependent siderophore receptor [Paracoccus aestuariivivens]MTH77135.1 TonB-dependent siderophore receptor [Paracoccus aestuariivivens]